MIKGNLTTIVEGLVKGENISKLTKRILGKMLSRNELSHHLKKHCGVSLSDIVGVTKLYKAKPNFVEAIVRLNRGKLANVVFNNVA